MADKPHIAVFVDGSLGLALLLAATWVCLCNKFMQWRISGVAVRNCLFIRKIRANKNIPFPPVILACGIRFVCG